MDLPAPGERFASDLEESIGNAAIHIKRILCMKTPTERCFYSTSSEHHKASSLFENCQKETNELLALQAMLHSLEGLNDRLICDAYELSESDIKALLRETGIPSSWHPLVANYDDLPISISELVSIPQHLISHLIATKPILFSSEEMVRIKDRLRASFAAGPGAKLGEQEENNDNGVEVDGEDNAVASVSDIPIPTETFLEVLSQDIALHPISIYRLLEDMRHKEGLVCPPELKRQMEDYASVTILRQLGFRWPEQDAYEREHGPIIDPALVAVDGIIPLVRCGSEPSASERLHLRLERDFGEAGAAQSESEFRQWVGRPLDEWLRREFFKRHIQQFKQRPIAWHFVSPKRTFEAFVLYHQLCDEATGRATLQRLRTQYGGGLIERLRAEQDRARANKDEKAITQMQLAIEDVEDFRTKLEAIERGDTLAHRIRCRWKGDEARVGRPGPYTPDINDGVKVNIRPFQEAGLLAVPVIKKWE